MTLATRNTQRATLRIMKCNEIEILLSAYIDGEVTSQEKHVVEEHIKICPDCKAMMAAFDTIHKLHQNMEMKRAPKGFRQRVTQRLETQPRFAFPWRLPRLVYVLSFSLFVLLSGTIILLHVMNQEPDQQQASVDIDVYAEDILFDQATVSESEIFSVGTESVAEEILSTIDFGTTDTSRFFNDDRSLQNYKFLLSERNHVCRDYDLDTRGV